VSFCFDNCITLQVLANVIVPESCSIYFTNYPIHT